jgi:Mg-chelatase subunit ChlD
VKSEEKLPEKKPEVVPEKHSYRYVKSEEKLPEKKSDVVPEKHSYRYVKSEEKLSEKKPEVVPEKHSYRYVKSEEKLPEKKPEVVPEKPNKASKVDVEWKTSLHTANLGVNIPKIELAGPPRVMILFGIDGSQSMEKEGRLRAVTTTLIDTLIPQALEKIKGVTGAKIAFNIFTFNKKAEEILPPTELTEQSQKQIAEKLRKITLNGGTDIFSSLSSIIQQIGKQERDKTLKEVVVILTDGEDKIAGKDPAPIHAAFNALKAETFAIGIGQEHQRETLKAIIPNKENYIDASKGGEEIKKGLEKIYNQVVVFSCPVTLTSSDLNADQVKIDGQPCAQKNGLLDCVLGEACEGKPLMKTIKISRKNLKAPLDLSKVSLQLKIPTHAGIEEIPLQWNPSPVMDPAILNRAK